MKKIFMALAVLMASGLPAQAEVANPPPLASNQSIVDAANLLTPSEEVDLERGIRGIYDNTQHHIVVLTMPTLNNVPATDYIHNAFKFYKIGNATRNDGVLLLISMANPRRIQIENGRGLEGVMTDAKTVEITNAMVPRMKAGDYRLAIEQAVYQIGLVVSQEKVSEQQILAAKQNTAIQEAQRTDHMLGFLVVLAGLLLVAGLVCYLIYRKHKKDEEKWNQEFQASVERNRKAREAALAAAGSKPQARPKPSWTPGYGKTAAPVGRRSAEERNRDTSDPWAGSYVPPVPAPTYVPPTPSYSPPSPPSPSYDYSPSPSPSPSYSPDPSPSPSYDSGGGSSGGGGGSDW